MTLAAGLVRDGDRAGIGIEHVRAARIGEVGRRAGMRRFGSGSRWRAAVTDHAAARIGKILTLGLDLLHHRPVCEALDALMTGQAPFLRRNRFVDLLRHRLSRGRTGERSKGSGNENREDLGSPA